MSRSPRKSWRAIARRIREARMIAAALKSPERPVLAHIVPIRRCNLACAYCNEYDTVSKPVPTSEMLRRINRLSELGTLVITMSGGEPLLHPQLDELISAVRSRGIFATMITNGYLLTPERIKRLNRAGLDELQISIDNVQPDDVSKKSLKVLDRKLEWLAQYAEFDVNINSVVGSTIRHPEDAVAVARRSRELGLTSTIGMIHDDSGQLAPLVDSQLRAYEQIRSLPTPFHTAALYRRYHDELVRGKSVDWHCGAGGRYLYICEDGLVHYCSQQRGYPAIPLEIYTRDDVVRESRTEKGCAPHCTISCVQRVAMIDELRTNPRQATERYLPPGADVPVVVAALRSLLVSTKNDRRRSAMQRAALRALGVR